MFVFLFLLPDVLSTGVKVNYDLTIDSERELSRGVVGHQNGTSRSIQTTFHLNKAEMCRNHTVYMEVGHISYVLIKTYEYND